MAFEKKSLDDYVDVAARIAEWRAQHPEGSLQPADVARPYWIERLPVYDNNGNERTQTFIVYMAAAYRSPDDPRPGIGLAYEEFPGRTPYTKNSELQNAETSAWGRAIVAALGADTRRGIASQEEVRNRQAERDQQPQQHTARYQRADSQGDEWSTPPDQDVPMALQVQLTRLNILLKAKLTLEGDARLSALSSKMGRQIGSTKELTRAEASALIDELTAMPDATPAAAPELSHLAAELAAGIEECGNLDDLGSMQLGIKAAVEAGNITPADREHLLTVYSARGNHLAKLVTA